MCRPVHGSTDTMINSAVPVDSDDVGDSPIRPARCPRLPNEIASTVIDYLHDDLRSLKQCSLVCSQWLMLCSGHLFEHVAWPPCRTKQRALCIAQVPGDGWYEVCLRRFLGSKRIGHAVTSLWLGRHRCERQELDRPLNLNVIAELLRHLPRLTSLRLIECDILSVPLLSRPCPPVLQDFSVSWRVRSDTTPMLQFLASLPPLSKAALSWPNPGIRPDDTKLIFPAFSHVLQVDTLHLDSETMIYCLAPLIDLKSIRKLCISHCGLSPLWLPFVRSMVNLNSLTYSPTAISGMPDLRIRLQSLTIRSTFHVHHGPESSDPDWKHIIRDLESHTYQDLQELTIAMDLLTETGLEGHDLLVRVEEYLSMLDWDALKDLSLFRYQSLPTFRIAIRLLEGDVDDILLQVIRNVIAGRLPERIRCILRVVEGS